MFKIAGIQIKSNIIAESRTGCQRPVPKKIIITFTYNQPKTNNATKNTNKMMNNDAKWYFAMWITSDFPSWLQGEYDAAGSRELRPIWGDLTHCPRTIQPCRY